LCKTNMMKIKNLLKCYAADDAIKEGIADFYRLSGYKTKNKEPTIINNKKTNISKNRLLLLLVSFAAKVIR
jgi:hypothetical protein